MISQKTLVAAYQALQKHVPDVERRGDLLQDLTMVPGNRSFTDSMSALLELHTRVEDDMRQRADGLEMQILAILEKDRS